MLFAWLFISLCVSASAQEYHTIKGIVVDANTSAPIAGVNIIGKYLYAISADNGEFVIKNVTAGKHRFEITHIGYGQGDNSWYDCGPCRVGVLGWDGAGRTHGGSAPEVLVAGAVRRSAKSRYGGHALCRLSTGL